MENYLINNSMDICFNSETMMLKAAWMPQNASLSVIEYVDCWIAVLKYTEVFKPQYLLLDAYDFNYRIIPEVFPVVNNIVRVINSKNIAVVMAFSILNHKTLNEIIKNSSLYDCNIFETNDKGNAWLISRRSTTNITILILPRSAVC